METAYSDARTIVPAVHPCDKRYGEIFATKLQKVIRCEASRLGNYIYKNHPQLDRHFDLIWMWNHKLIYGYQKNVQGVPEAVALSPT